MAKPVLTYAVTVSIDGLGEFGEYRTYSLAPASSPFRTVASPTSSRNQGRVETASRIMTGARAVQPHGRHAAHTGA